VERVVDPLPGPYVLKVLTFWIIFGTPGMVLTRYLDTFNTEKMISLFGVPSPQNILLFSLANFVMPLYAFYGIHHMRQRISLAMPELKRVASDEASTVERIFSAMTRLLPAIVLSILFSVISLVSLPGQTQQVAGYMSLTVKIVGFAFSMLGYGTFVWIYASSITGLYRLGRKNLRFTSLYEDKHLGMKFLGSISLSLVWVYFLGIGLVFFSFSPLPLLLLFALGGLIALGVTLFFLPLHEVHVKMMKEKQVVGKALHMRLHRVVDALESGKESPGEIRDLLAFQILEQSVSKIAEWPFDPATLNWLSAIVISISGTIITKYLLSFLGA